MASITLNVAQAKTIYELAEKYRSIVTIAKVSSLVILDLPGGETVFVLSDGRFIPASEV